MEPITWAAVAVIIAAGAGFGAGWGLKPDATIEAIQAQNETIEALGKGNQELIAEVQRVAIEEAERKTLLAENLTVYPPMCLTELNGDPMSPLCAWAWCIRTGVSDAQRCQEQTLQAFIIEDWQNSSDLTESGDEVNR